MSWLTTADLSLLLNITCSIGSFSTLNESLMILSSGRTELFSLICLVLVCSISYNCINPSFSLSRLAISAISESLFTPPAIDRDSLGLALSLRIKSDPFLLCWLICLIRASSSGSKLTSESERRLLSVRSLVRLFTLSIQFKSDVPPITPSYNYKSHPYDPLISSISIKLSQRLNRSYRVISMTSLTLRIFR